VSRRTAPRALGAALEDLTAAIAPASTLARVQEAWERAVGPMIAAAANPVAERDGILSVACESAVWAQELTLMQSDLLASLNRALGAQTLRELRCRPA
jgi:predicted nucleic acid-binding Zn ribbon protein